jgi:hypothetical protein
MSRDQGPSRDLPTIRLDDDLPEPFEFISECIDLFRQWALAFAFFCIFCAMAAFSVGTFSVNFF